VVVGLVGERTWWSPRRPASVWDLSIKVPLIPLYLDVVTLIGLIIGLLGLSLILFLERVVAPEQRWTPPLCGASTRTIPSEAWGGCPPPVQSRAMSGQASRPALQLLPSPSVRRS